MRYRLIKPEWARVPVEDGGIPGSSVIEGDDFTEEFLRTKNECGYGVFYFPNYNSRPIEDKFLSGKNVDCFNWVFVDMDLKDGVYSSPEEFLQELASFEHLPNKVVHSGNGVHAYWRVKDLTREQYCALQMKLIKRFRTDKSVWTVLQLMRLEGYKNTKSREAFKMVEAEQWASEPYTCQDLSKALPDLSEEEEKKIVNHLRKIDGKEPEIDFEEVDVEDLPEKFCKLLEKNKKVRHLFTDETGDKSENAWQLANILFEEDFSKQEALSVIANCPKALSKGRHRLSWSISTVEKVYRNKSEYVVPSAAEMFQKGGATKRKGRRVYGPEYFDCLENGWRTQQVLTLVAGTGIGKSTVALNVFKSILENSQDHNDICIYFNLEMPKWEILEKWHALTKGDRNLAERLFVVSNEDEDGNPLNLNLQKIYWFCRDIAKSTGKTVVAISIDHIGVINPTIDIRKKPDFGMVGDMDGALGDLRNMTLRKMPQAIKDMAKQLDTFVILQSQTTKSRGAGGDVLLGVDAAYGAAQIEFYSDYVLTLCQPLRRVHHKTDLRALGYQYVKIRSKSKSDEMDTYDPRFAVVDLDTGALRSPTEAEEEEFVTWNKAATVLRKKSEKKEEEEYKPIKRAGISKLKTMLAVK